MISLSVGVFFACLFWAVIIGRKEFFELFNGVFRYIRGKPPIKGEKYKLMGFKTDYFVEIKDVNDGIVYYSFCGVEIEHLEMKPLRDFVLVYKIYK